MILISGIGMVNMGKSYVMFKVSGVLYWRVIVVMKGLIVFGYFVFLNENEFYYVEYWLFELYKFMLVLLEVEFFCKVVLIIGGVGGIGSVVCCCFVVEGGYVIVVDFNIEGV